VNWKSSKLLFLLLVLFPGNLAGAETHFGGTASLSGVVKGGADANLTLHLELTVDNPVRYYAAADHVHRGRGLAAQVKGLDQSFLGG
jgi:hypothetical protein